MPNTLDFPLTHQGVRDLDQPRRPEQAGRSRVNVGSTERAVSSVGGAMLAGLGVSQGGLLGLALAVVGGSLIYRGQTGHCTLYAATGMNTAQ